MALKSGEFHRLMKWTCQSVEVRAALTCSSLPASISPIVSSCEQDQIRKYYSQRTATSLFAVFNLTETPAGFCGAAVIFSCLLGAARTPCAPAQGSLLTTKNFKLFISPCLPIRADIFLDFRLGR